MWDLSSQTWDQIHTSACCQQGLAYSNSLKDGLKGYTLKLQFFKKIKLKIASSLRLHFFQSILQGAGRCQPLPAAGRTVFLISLTLFQGNQGVFPESSPLWVTPCILQLSMVFTPTPSAGLAQLRVSKETGTLFGVAVSCLLQCYMLLLFLRSTRGTCLDMKLWVLHFTEG